MTNPTMQLLSLFQLDRKNLLVDVAPEFATESSPRELQDLEATRAWQDLKVALEARIIDLRDQLEIPHPEVVNGEEYDIPDPNHVRGQLYAYRAVLALPETLRKEILLRRQENEEREDG
jgi:hypothetical protein